MRLFVLLCSLFLSTQLAAQAVYKTVDEDGNVIYTDQPPEGDVQPMDLPKISVVKTEPLPFPQATFEGSGGSGTAANPYGSLEVLEPTADQTYWGTGGTVTVRLNVDPGLAAGHRIQYFIDGAKVGRTTSLAQLFPEIDRGEHQLRAEIVDENGDVVTSSASITFHMKQQSQQNPNNPVNKKKPVNKPAKPPRRPRGN